MIWHEVYRWLVPDSVLRAYLLSDLPQSRRDRLERQYFLSAGLYERLEMLEDQLVDAYLRGQLSRADNAKFEERYLTSEASREKVRRARSLIQIAHAEPSEAVEEPARSAILRRLIFRPIGAAALIVVMLAVGSQYWLSQRVTVVPLNVSDPARSAPTAQAGSSVVRIPWIARAVRFELPPLGAQVARYSLALRNDGALVTEVDVRPEPGMNVAFEVPTSRLATGAYELVVRGFSRDDVQVRSEELRFELAMSRAPFN